MHTIRTTKTVDFQSGDEMYWVKTYPPAPHYPYLLEFLRPFP